MNDGLSISDIGPGIYLHEEDKQELKRIAMDLHELVSHPGWQHLKRLSEEMISRATPKVTEFTSEDATRIASRNVYISGIQSVLEIPYLKKFKMK